MTVDTILGSDVFFAGMGTIIYNHAAIVKQADEVRLRTGTGRNDVNFEKMPFDVTGNQIFLQIDMFDGVLNSYAWVPGEPTSLVEVEHAYQPVNTSPVVGIRYGAATIHELLISDRPFVVDSADGDYNANGVIDAGDTDILIAAIGSNDFYYDRNDDKEVNPEDLSHWVHVAANSWIGDANLDGEFNSGDLVAVFEAGKYERDVTANWSEGDWDGDGHFGTGDLVAAFKDGGYELGPRMPLNAVPEPVSTVLLMGGLIGIAFCRRRKGQ